jgi:hypothetical protein
MPLNNKPAIPRIALHSRALGIPSLLKHASAYLPDGRQEIDIRSEKRQRQALASCKQTNPGGGGLGCSARKGLFCPKAGMDDPIHIFVLSERRAKREAKIDSA